LAAIESSIASKPVHRKKSQFALVWIRFRKNKLAMLGLILLSLLLIFCLAAPLYIDSDRVYAQNIGNRFRAPDAEYLFGTDQFGRDLFARIMYGGRISLLIGLSATGISFVIGAFLGCVSGYFGKISDTIIMRLCDILMSVPGILLSMAIVAALGQGLFNMLIALSVASIPGRARIARAAIFTLKGQEFIEAARCCGTSHARIIYRHMLPNIIGPLIIDVMFGLGGVILTISALGFLGIGIAPPTPEWGTIISENRINLLHHPHLGIVPGLFIIVAVLSLNFVGDGLRDALDPKQKN